MKTLQEAIVERGIENVKIQFIGESCIDNELNAICTLSKYLKDDDFTGYVHKIVVTSEKPYINTWGEERPNNHSYYFSDLESDIKHGYAKIII